jgi:hypothetical protein
MKIEDPWVEQQISRLTKTQEDFKQSQEAQKQNTAKAE